MAVIKGFESTPHKAVFFVVERHKEAQEWNEQKMRSFAVCSQLSLWWRNGRTVKNSSRSQKKKWIFVDKRRRSIERSGVQ